MENNKLYTIPQLLEEMKKLDLKTLDDYKKENNVFLTMCFFQHIEDGLEDIRKKFEVEFGTEDDIFLKEQIIFLLQEVIKQLKQ